MHENTHARTSFFTLFNATRIPINRNEMSSILAADRGTRWGRKAAQQVHRSYTPRVPSIHIPCSILSTGFPGKVVIVLLWSTCAAHWLTEPVSKWERKSVCWCELFWNRRQISYFRLHLKQTWNSIYRTNHAHLLLALLATRFCTHFLLRPGVSCCLRLPVKYIKCHLKPLKKLIVFALVLCRLLHAR